MVGSSGLDCLFGVCVRLYLLFGVISLGLGDILLFSLGLHSGRKQPEVRVFYLLGEPRLLLAVFCVFATHTAFGASKAGLPGNPVPLTSSEYVLPGKFEWEPDLSPEGPVSIAVNLSLQKLEVFRGGTLIARSSISSGRAGHSTPVGTFSILEKELIHHSNLYDNAPMPFMQRLTWHGLALHAGNLPGCPASHGCIRLPSEFAKRLYQITSRGDEVTVAGKASEFRLPSRASIQKLAQPKKALIIDEPSTVTQTESRPKSGVRASDPLLSSAKSMRELEAEECRIRSNPDLTPEQRRAELKRVWSLQRALLGTQ